MANFLRKKWKPLSIGALLVFVTLRPSVDLDLGWHLRYGEYFFQNHRVLTDNIISFIWPDYKWVQASWGYDLILYQIFSRFGFWGITLTCSLIILLIFMIVTRPIRNKNIFILLFLLSIFLTQEDAIFSAGLRAQTVSTVFFALTATIIFSFIKRQKNQKSRFPQPVYFLPLILLIWANLHGGVVLGLIMIALSWLVWGILILTGRVPGKRNWLILTVISTISLLVTLVNPWGVRLITEALRHATDLNISFIDEWQPRYLYPFESIVTGIIFTITIVVLILRKKAQDVPFLAVYLAVTVLAYMANRFAVNFGVLSVLYLSGNLGDIRFSQKRILNFLKILLTIFILADLFYFRRYYMPFDISLINFSWDDYCQTTLDCSEEITQIMLKDPPAGKGLHPYNYGGYLSWRVPSVKTFIDGRMAAWVDNSGNSPPIEDSTKIDTSAGPIVFRNLDKVYHFDWVILYTPSRLVAYLESEAQLNKWQVIYTDPWYSYFIKK